MNIDNVMLHKAIGGLLIITVLISAFNMYQVIGFENKQKSHMTSMQLSQGSSQTALAAGGNAAPVAVQGPDVTPRGIPDIYGKELGISFDDVSATNPKKADATIRTLGALDTQIRISGPSLERYIAVASQISCEYCCGADSIITPNGEAACGCAHSFAMRGLAKYLITKHGSEYTNDEILEELGKWKTLFFPGKISAKAAVLQDKGIELSYINLASNKYRGIEAEAQPKRGSGSGGQVGGC